MSAFALQKTLTLLTLMLFEIVHSQASNIHDYKYERPFLVRDIEIGDVKLPLSPITVIIFAVSAIILYRVFTKSSSAVASHILLEGSSDEIKDKMIKMKAKGWKESEGGREGRREGGG